MYILKATSRFKKDFNLCEKRNLDIPLLEELIDCLLKHGKVPAKHRPHLLKGDYKKHWECHIKPDWLLIWLQDDENKEIRLVRTGTHSELF